MPEIRQKVNETVIQYASRCAEILFELRTKIGILDLNMQFQLTTAEATAYNTIDEAITNRKKPKRNKKKQALSFNMISGFHWIAGFKEIEERSTSIVLIKAEAMQIELILEENKKKSAITRNGSKPVAIYQINENRNQKEWIQRTKL